MSATLVQLLGTTGIHGIAEDETGLIIRSIKEKSRKQSNFLKNRVGNRVGRADYDHSIEVTIEGELTATTGFAQAVSTELTIANALTTDFLPDGQASSGMTLIDDVERSSEREGWVGISVSAELLPCFES